MILQNKYILLFLLIGNVLIAQESRYGLSFANEVISGNTLCLDIELRFKNEGKLGSSNLVMKYNKVMLANPVLASNNLPIGKYSTTTLTNPVDSLAAFNIELLTENDGMTIATAPAKTVLGRLCFDVLAGMDAGYLDWQIKSTTATVVFLDDESTLLKRGRIAAFCNNEGQACDDGDPNTSDDKYDANCLCTGVQIACIDDATINDAAIPARTYKSRMKINSEGLIRTNAKVDFRAGQSITLSAGFHAEEGSDFSAKIEDCMDNLVEEIAESRVTKSNPSLLNGTTLEDLTLSVSPNPILGAASITYVLPTSEKVNIALYSMEGKLMQTLLTADQSNGMHLVEWQTNTIPPGMYLLNLKTTNSSTVQKVVLQ